MFLSLDPPREAKGCRGGEDIATVDMLGPLHCTRFVQVAGDIAGSRCFAQVSAEMNEDRFQLRWEDRKQCVDEDC